VTTSLQKKIVVLSGAGISAESGIKTFRDSDGLWEGHAVSDVATPEGWSKNPELVLDFYNQRRKQLLEVQPNRGHQIIAALENDFEVSIITQNVDNLHEKSGSTSVIHLHGELLKVRSVANPNYILDWQQDLYLGDVDTEGNQLRPDIVWFGEEVPTIELAISMVQNADILLIIGTSLQVYPAASLIHYAKPTIPTYYIDPNPSSIYNLPKNLKVIATTGSKGMEIVQKELEKWKV
jgi:NAD-dependent deacetylase